MSLPTIHAFWSYSRTIELQGADALHAAMQVALEEASAPMPLHVFRDTSSTGFASGEDWRRGIVRAVGLSTIFFWVQSPRWLHRDVCRFEFEAFRDRVRRAAALLAPGAAQGIVDDLWHALVVPIRWLDADDDQWLSVPEPARTTLAADWKNMSVSPSLMLPQARRRLKSAADLYSLACIDAAAAIRARIGATFAKHGTSWAQWSELVASDAASFERLWMDEFERRAAAARDGRGAIPAQFGSPSIAMRQDELSRRFTDGRTRLERPELGLTLVLVPSDRAATAAFWCASTSVANRHARMWARRFGEPCRPEPGPTGALNWSRETIEALRPALREDGVEIPAAWQAADLARTFANARETIHRLGFQSVPRAFWTVAEDGRLATPAGGEQGELLLVASLEGTHRG